MTAIVYDFDRVKRAVVLSRELGMPETQATVAARIAADMRSEQTDWEGLHAAAYATMYGGAFRFEHPRCRCVVVPFVGTPDSTQENAP